MKITTRGRLAIAATAAALVVGLVVGPAHANTSLPPPALVSVTLAQASMPPTLLTGHGKTLAGSRWGMVMLTGGMTDAYAVDNKFGLGTSTGWHSHPGPSLIFVVAGPIIDYDSSNPHCAPVSYPTGSTIIDIGGNDVHMLRNEGTMPAETIAVQFIPSGQPRKVSEPEPVGCNIP
jgi:hypothetical protein